MAHALIALLVLADEPAPARVYRSRAELPASWAICIPTDFDWEKEMLAGSAPGNTRILVIAPESTKEVKGDLVVQPKRPRFCQPCRRMGMVMEDDFRGISKKDQPLDPPSMFRVPRTRARVIVLSAEAEICRPCNP